MYIKRLVWFFLFILSGQACLSAEDTARSISNAGENWMTLRVSIYDCPMQEMEKRELMVSYDQTTGDSARISVMKAFKGGTVLEKVKSVYFRNMLYAPDSLCRWNWCIPLRQGRTFQERPMQNLLHRHCKGTGRTPWGNASRGGLCIFQEKALSSASGRVGFTH
jgi:hypothetical protein